MKKGEALDEIKNQVIEQHIDPLIEKVKKCYSQERYEHFQEAVEKIIGRYLRSVVGWAVFVWLITLIASMLIQKFFKIFGS